MGELMLAASVLMAVALAASLLAGWIRIPALLLFLGIGMAIGSDGFGWVNFNDYVVARDIGIIALALILFEGGLTTGIDQLRPVAKAAVSLAVICTILTALIAGAAAVWLFDLSLLDGLLLGSIVACTDAAAIFAVLQGVGLKRRVSRMLEGEAGVNDPIAILLVIGFIDWITEPGYGIADMLLLFVQQVTIGVAVGAAVGWLGTRVLRSVALPTIGLYPVASLTAGGLAFGLTEVLNGSGFLAVYLTGLALGSAMMPARRTIIAFHGGLAWVAQLTMFLTLGLLVFPSQLGSIALEGTLLALILVFVARPIASVVATAFSPLRPGERVLLGWAGLRGAVPVVLATLPVIAGVEGSLDFFNIVFFAVVLTLLIQGPTFEPLARRLGLTTVHPSLPEPLAEVGTIRGLGAEVIEYPVGSGHAAAGALVRELGLPREAVVNVIVRGEQAIPPRGSTRIEAGDRLHVLVRREVTREVAALMDRWKHGPLEAPRRPRRLVRGRSPVFSVRPYTPGAVGGEIDYPNEVAGNHVVARLRTKRSDPPGALVALEDGRYALAGPMVVIGSRNDLTAYARRRLPQCGPDERLWLQTVIGALAVDTFD